jgi:ribosomal protein S18 acetylase RimI-like enzyme
MALRPDPWLAQFLNKPVWHLTATGRDLDETPIPAETPCFVDGKVPVSDIETSHRFQNAGFRLIDTNILLERPAWPIARSRTARPADAGDRDAIERIAATAFTFSRFHLDPEIPKSAADSIKRAWAGNFFEGERGDHMIVSVVEDVVAGFLQVLHQGDLMVIDLVAVDPRFRGKGLARDMIAFAESHMHGIERIQVGTQAANARSLHAYVGDRFQFISATYVFHYHG